MENINLKNFVNTYEETDVNKMLKNFKSISISNKKNDIEIFLQEKAIKFEKSCISSTYLVYDDNIEEMLGYFTIANRSLILSKEELKESMKPEKYIGRSSVQVEDFIKRIIKPILDENKDILGLKADINV